MAGEFQSTGNVGTQDLGSDWDQRARNWVAPTQQQIDRMGYTNPQQIAMYVLNKMFEDTNAEGYLSPLYMSMMRKNAVQPYMVQQVMAGASPGGGQIAGNYGDFLKAYVTSTAGGWGNVNQDAYKNMLQSLLNNLGAARNNARSGQMSDFGSYWNSAPDLMAGALGLMSYGPAGNIQRQKLQSAAEMAWGRAAGDQNKSEDWIRYMLGRVNPYSLQY